MLRWFKFWGTLWGYESPNSALIDEQIPTLQGKLDYLKILAMLVVF
jgi:hypothetical protein